MCNALRSYFSDVKYCIVICSLSLTVMSGFPPSAPV